MSPGQSSPAAARDFRATVPCGNRKKVYLTTGSGPARTARARLGSAGLTIIFDSASEAHVVSDVSELDEGTATRCYV